jgi:hypothetical protein
MRDPFGMYRLTPDSYLTLQRSDDDPDIAVKVLGFNDCHFEFNNPVFGTPFMRYRPMESSSTQKFTVDEVEVLRIIFMAAVMTLTLLLGA